MSIFQHVKMPPITPEEAHAVMEQIHEHILFCRKTGAVPSRVVVGHQYHDVFLREYRAFAARLIFGNAVEILDVPVWVDYSGVTVFRVETDRDPC